MRAITEILSANGNANSASLFKALHMSEHLKYTVQACAGELSGLRTVLQRDAESAAPLRDIKHVLQQSEQVEQTVIACADQLQLMNAALRQEIKERIRLEEMLKATRAKLFMTQAELFDTQVEDEKIRHLAFHDALTGLPNRSMFSERLNTAIHEAADSSSALAVFFIDLDGFKQINDQYGHTAGDKILRTVAARLRDSVRAGDTVSRHGGDEFTCLLPAMSGTADIANLARELVEVISQPIALEGASVSVRPSIGISLYGSGSDTAATLIKNADMAMYRAKQQEKAYCFFFQLTHGAMKAR